MSFIYYPFAILLSRTLPDLALQSWSFQAPLCFLSLNLLSLFLAYFLNFLACSFSSKQPMSLFPDPSDKL